MHNHFYEMVHGFLDKIKLLFNFVKKSMHFDSQISYKR
jgi:hypothetical protein